MKLLILFSLLATSFLNTSTFGRDPEEENRQRLRTLRRAIDNINRRIEEPYKDRQPRAGTPSRENPHHENNNVAQQQDPQLGNVNNIIIHNDDSE